MKLSIFSHFGFKIHAPPKKIGVLGIFHPETMKQNQRNPQNEHLWVGAVLEVY